MRTNTTTILEIYNDHKITTTDGMLNLTDMWKATGEVEAKKPKHYFELTQANELVEVLKSSGKGRENRPYKNHPWTQRFYSRPPHYRPRLRQVSQPRISHLVQRNPAGFRVHHRRG